MHYGMSALMLSLIHIYFYYFRTEGDVQIVNALSANMKTPYNSQLGQAISDTWIWNADAMIAVPVIAVIAILYNSPFALFLPPLESGDTVQTVTSAYVQEFNRDVNTKVNEHTGYDLGELVYVDYEGMEENPSNYYDIMAVYMVKHGIGDTATVMNDISKGWLQAVVNDMLSLIHILIGRP